MSKLEITVNTSSNARNSAFNIRRPTFRAYLFTPAEDGRTTLSEAHFVDGRNEVRPLGTYDPAKDVVPNVGSVTYRVEPIATDKLQSEIELVYRRNFG